MKLYLIYFAFIICVCYCLKPMKASRIARQASCYNYHVSCDYWARQGQCTRNPGYMSYYCKKSCGKCSNWANWSSWSLCSRSCGGGYKSRRRTCSGRNCAGSSTQTIACNNSPCVGMKAGCFDGNRWCEDWARKGECTRNPSYMLKTCKKSCNQCIVHGNWANWGRWSLCSKSCGGGHKSRRRTCSNPAPSNGGRNCAGSSTQTTACTNLPCVVPVHGNWGSWTLWSVCSKTCGGGQKYRSRTCSNPAPNNGGRNCQGSNRQTTACNAQGCPVDGEWGAWGDWTPCSKSCDIGIARRNRYCNDPRPQNNGRPCIGNNKETRRCSLRRCPTPSAVTSTPPMSIMCGRPKKSRIVGGKVASNRDWPWQVGLQTLDDDFIFCGGSLIDREWVLTAAHCIFRNNPSRNGCVEPNPGLRVVIGEFDVLNTEGHEVYKTISKVCMHPNYNHSIFNNDIALLRFDSPLSGYNETMLPVCLPSTNTRFPAGTNCSVTGWGKTHQSGWVSNKLRVAKVPIMDHATCKEEYLKGTGDIVTDRMICAGYKAGMIDSCKGDSGGPLVCQERGRYVLAGATSWGVGCAQAGRPGVYTDIKDFVSWINDKLYPEP